MDQPEQRVRAEFPDSADRQDLPGPQAAPDSQVLRASQDPQEPLARLDRQDRRGPRAIRAGLDLVVPPERQDRWGLLEGLGPPVELGQLERRGLTACRVRPDLTERLEPPAGPDRRDPAVQPVRLGPADLQDHSGRLERMA